MKKGIIKRRKRVVAAQNGQQQTNPAGYASGSPAPLQQTPANALAHSHQINEEDAGDLVHVQRLNASDSENAETHPVTQSNQQLSRDHHPPAIDFTGSFATSSDPKGDQPAAPYPSLEQRNLTVSPHQESATRKRSLSAMDGEEAEVNESGRSRSNNISSLLNPSHTVPPPAVQNTGDEFPLDPSLVAATNAAYGGSRFRGSEDARNRAMARKVELERERERIRAMLAENERALAEIEASDT